MLLVRYGLVAGVNLLLSRIIEMSWSVLIRISIWVCG